MPQLRSDEARSVATLHFTHALCCVKRLPYVNRCFINLHKGFVELGYIAWVKFMGRKRKYREPTKDVTITLPQTAIDNLDMLAQTLDLPSRSELIARIGLGEISIGTCLGELLPN